MMSIMVEYYNGGIKLSFFEKIVEICKKYNRVALFVDLDGTVAEYRIFPKNYITVETKGLFLESKPLFSVIEVLEKLSQIENLDIYILSLSRSKIIVEEKKIWLKKYMPFINEDKYIIVCRETGEYNYDNREYIKSQKMKEKLEKYDFLIFLDDEHNILRRAQEELGDRGEVFHVSSVMV